MNGFVKLKFDFIDAVFPHTCLCGKWGEVLCVKCRAEIRIFKRGQCPICKALSTNGKTCSTCRPKTSLTGVMVVGPHEGVLKDIVWDLKYGFLECNSSVIADLLLEKISSQVGGIFKKNPLLVPVPIGSHRKNWRGFNQSELIANRLSEKLTLKQKTLLFKNNAAIPQVGLTRKERLVNIRGNISYRGDVVVNTRVVLVDDVYTTGATLEECARVLRLNGYKEVWGLVVTRD